MDLTFRQTGQDNRLVKLTTPLGGDVLLPQRVVATERLSRGYEYTVDCIAVRGDIQLKKLIAQPVALWIQQLDRSYLPVHGYVHRIKRLSSDGQSIYCQLSFAPWLHFLKFRKDARINPIVEGTPTFLIAGRMVALQGHHGACGCTLISSLITATHG